MGISWYSHNTKPSIADFGEHCCFIEKPYPAIIRKVGDGLRIAHLFSFFSYGEMSEWEGVEAEMAVTATIIGDR
jgi:hypothetical protein